MNTLHKIIFLSFLSLLAAGCSLEETDNGIDPGKKGDFTLSLSATVGAMNTKATTPGDDTYNENTLDNFYYFIYSDAEGATCLAHGFNPDNTLIEVVLDGTPLATEAEANGSATGYVYVIANPPQELLTAIENLAVRSLSNIKALTIQTQFCTDNAKNGRVFTNNRFIMLSKDTMENGLLQFTLTRNAGGPSATVVAPLYRLAAKVVLDLFVAQSVDENKTNTDGSQSYIKTWYPTLEKTDIYALWVSNFGALSGDPLIYDDANASHFFGYPRYAMNADPANESSEGVSSGDVHISHIATDSNGQYTTTRKSYEVKEYEKDSNGDYILDGEGNLIPIPGATVEIDYYSMQSVPFYSYPISWETTDSHAPFIKVIVTWNGYDKYTQQPSDAKAKEYYYKISVPNTLDLLSNNCYRITADLSVLGSESDDVPVEIEGTCYVSNWVTETGLTKDYTATRYLSVGRTNYVMYGDELEIPVVTSHPFEVVDFSASYELSPTETITEPTWSTALGSDGFPDYDNWTVVSSSNSAYAYVRHKIHSSITEFTNLDVRIITYKFKLRHPDNTAYTTQEITVVQYPPIYIESKTGGNSFINGYFASLTTQPLQAYGVSDNQFGATRANGSYYTSIGTDNSNHSGYVLTDYGRLDKGANTGINVNLTFVSVSAFQTGHDTYTVKSYNGTEFAEETFTYMIADPRQESGWTQGSSDLAAYLSNMSNQNTTVKTAWTDAQVQAIKIGVQNPIHRSFIAPSFIMSSRWSRPGNDSGIDFEAAIKRCATYQEAGYPAGRWRLPTEAETYFCYMLQENTSVTFPSLYSPGDGYYTANGNVFGDQRGNTADTFTFQDWSSRNNHSVRCVYDSWYWGAEPVSDDVRYFPGPTF